MDNRISTLCADVEKLPLRDNLADFIMCRGSIGFWPVPVQGITEIYRVLKPGGCAIVGVGAGRYMPETMRRRDLRVHVCFQIEQLPRQYTLEDYDAFARQAMLSDYRVILEDDISKGCWLEVKK
ncbi:MAG: class I SAM-dependent methyltransferase [Enterocloster clostridioformis]